MPRYLLETTTTTAEARERAGSTAARRFPEVAVERLLSTGDGGGGRDLWVCRAPSAAHIRRWADACRLALTTLHAIEVETTQSLGRTP